MSRRRIKIPNSKPKQAFDQDKLIGMNKELVMLNAKIKENTNKMVEEIGCCLDEIFMRLSKLEEHCGIVYPREPIESQTNDEPTLEMATSTDTSEPSSNSEQPCPEVVREDPCNAV